MAFDFSTLFWIFLAIMVLQPLFTGRWYALRRAQAIRAIERLHGSRVITMIHRQEKRSIFGFAVSRHIDLEGAQTIIAAIKDTPDDMPIDLVLHTPGGLVLAAMQIVRAVEAHKAKVTVYVPVYAMSGCEHRQSPRLEAHRKCLRPHAGSRRYGRKGSRAS